MIVFQTTRKFYLLSICHLTASEQRKTRFQVCRLGLTPWNLSCSEFIFDDTRLFSWYKNKIGPIEFFCCILTLLSLCPFGCLSSAFLNWDSQHGKDIRKQQTKISIGPILFLYYEESQVLSNLNSKQFRFHGAHPKCRYSQTWNSGTAK